MTGKEWAPIMVVLFIGVILGGILVFYVTPML